MVDTVLECEQRLVAARQAADTAAQQAQDDADASNIAIGKAAASAQAAKEAKAAHFQAYTDLGTAIQIENAPPQTEIKAVEETTTGSTDAVIAAEAATSVATDAAKEL